jgi:hypothetical protein
LRCLAFGSWVGGVGVMRELAVKLGTCGALVVTVRVHTAQITVT